VLLLLLASSLIGEEALRIGTITIRRRDVFSPEEEARGWVYRAANLLHLETRTSVIEQFLLFGEGDLYDPSKLAETERNLRKLPFLKSATVVARPRDEGLVDVEVVTQDAWSTELSGTFSRKGEKATLGTSISESDLLGYGKQLSVHYAQHAERTIRSVEYRDPALLGPYWEGRLLYATNSDGRQKHLEVARPFYSLATSWSLKLAVDDLKQHEQIFGGGRRLSSFRGSHRQRLGDYGFLLRAGEGKAERLALGFDLVDDTFEPLPPRPSPMLPENRSFRYLFARYELLDSDYVKCNFVNRDSRYEDFNLGPELSVQLGLSPAAFGLDRNTALLRASASRGWRLGDQGFLLGRLSYEGRIDQGVRNQIFSAGAGFVRKFETRLPQTFVSRLELDRGWRLDRDVQFFADGATGIRAYRLQAFEGDKRILLNLEHRVFSGVEVLQLFSPGAALFFDAAWIEPSTMSLHLSRSKKDVGLGLRFAISRASSNNVLRVDLARTLDPDPRGRRGWSLSFSSAQAF
jgi:hypothetical protein